MKILIFIAFNAFCQIVHAACNESQNSLEIEPELSYIRENVFVGSGHPKIDTLNIKAPVVIEELPLVKIIISDGGILDVPKFKIPLAHTIEGNFAEAAIEVDLNKIGDFNITFVYGTSACFKVFHKLVNG